MRGITALYCSREFKMWEEIGAVDGCMARLCFSSSHVSDVDPRGGFMGRRCSGSLRSAMAAPLAALVAERSDITAASSGAQTHDS